MEMISPFNEEEFKQSFLVAVNTEFEPYRIKAKELTDAAGTIVISNSGDLDMARGRILDTTSWMKLLDSSHKTIKAPLKCLVDILDSKKKEISDMVLSAKGVLTSKISFKETLDKQAKEKELRNAQILKQAEDKLILADTEIISRMVSNIKSMIFGGEMVTSKATTQRPGCFTLDELETVERIVASKLPGVSKFHVDCAAVYGQAIEMINGMIIGRKTSIMNGETVLSDIEMTVISDSTTILTNQMSQMARDDRKAEKAIEESQKGFRRTIQYEVIDINRIPREYLMLNESKINEYKTLYREQILEEMKKPEGTGHGFIEGLRFSVDQVSIIR